MASQRQIEAQLMAEALAELVLLYPKDVNSALLKYGIDASSFDPQMRLLYVEQMIQKHKDFAMLIVDMIGKKGGAYKNFALAGAIAGAVSGVTSGIASIIDATSDAGKQARVTMAQAALLQAQAQIEQAKANQLAAQRKQNLTAVIGVSTAGMVLAIGIFAYFKFGRKK